MVDTARLRLKVPADTRQLEQLRASIATVAMRSRVPTVARDRMIIAVDEAVTNVIKHGLTPDNSQKNIEIHVLIDIGRIEVHIQDHGRSYDPQGKQPSDILRHLRVGGHSGLGLYLINTTVDKIRYGCLESGANELVLTKYF